MKADQLWEQLSVALPDIPPPTLDMNKHWTRLHRLPSLGESYRSILLRRKAELPRGSSLPLVGLESEITMSTQWLRDYLEICNFEQSLKDLAEVPLTAPQVIAAPLQTSLLALPDLPVRILGVVHAANEITCDRPIPLDTPLRASVWVGETRWKARGFEFDLHTTISDSRNSTTTSPQVIWRARTVIFRSVNPKNMQARGVVSPPEPPLVGYHEMIDLPANLGRRYARIAGDYNPIHFYPITARLFGFKRPIIHGMWTLIRLLRIAQTHGDINSLSQGQLGVRFRRPLSLPSTFKGIVKSTASLLDSSLDSPSHHVELQALDQFSKSAVEAVFSPFTR